MWPERVLNPGPLALVSDTLLTALCSPALLSFLLILSQTSGTRKFTLRYQQFGMNLDSEISTDDSVLNS